MNYKISKEIVKTAKDNNCGIKLENLTGIRKTKNRSKDCRYSLNSWNFYQLRQMIEYKSRLLGNRQGKKFKCPCGHVDHADANASFNIGQSIIDSDIMEGNTDIPKGEILIKSVPEPPLIYRGEYVRNYLLKAFKIMKLYIFCRFQIKLFKMALENKKMEMN